MNHKTDNNYSLEKPPPTKQRRGLFYFDEELKVKNPESFLIGVDEAGRGPLAGPVVACAAYVPLSAAENLFDADDSKKLSPKKRKLLFLKMLSLGVKFGFGYSLSGEIDEVNILNATFRAMDKAVLRVLRYSGIAAQKALILVDGPHKIRNLELRQLPIIGGDGKSLSIACASVFAKVLRDNWMEIIDSRYPHYGFARHKGYGTKLHLEKIKEHGVSPEHRRSFAPVAESLCVR